MIKGNYDCIAKKVNEEVSNLADTATFAELAKIDEKLGLPRGAAFEMSGCADHWNFTEDE